MTPAELVQGLHALADEVGRMLGTMPEALPLMRVTLKPGPDGERVVLVCGLEPAPGRDDDGDQE